MRVGRGTEMKGIVDRFEDDIVVIEIDGVTQDIPKALVNPGVQAGDSVELVNGKWVADRADTESRRKKIKGLMEDVWED
jgi:hypothetical protein